MIWESIVQRFAKMLRSPPRQGLIWNHANSTENRLTLQELIQRSGSCWWFSMSLHNKTNLSCFSAMKWILILNISGLYSLFSIKVPSYRRVRWQALAFASNGQILHHLEWQHKRSELMKCSWIFTISTGQGTSSSPSAASASLAWQVCPSSKERIAGMADRNSFVAMVGSRCWKFGLSVISYNLQVWTGKLKLILDEIDVKQAGNVKKHPIENIRASICKTYDMFTVNFGY